MILSVLIMRRPAVSAISELAPENKFYAGGRRVRVDQVDLTGFQDRDMALLYQLRLPWPDR